MAHKTDDELIRGTHNTSRFFVEQHQIAWVLLIATIAWGIFGFIKMPQRKDPEIPIRQAMVIVPWPGASAERVEQLVTKRVEQQVTQNAKVTEVRSYSRTGQSVVTFELDENHLKDAGKELDDVKGKLDAIGELPDGAGPVQFIKDFGDTATLMLTVASPATTFDGEGKYSYRELDEMTDVIARTLQTVPQVTKVARSGVLDQQVFLNFSEDRLAAYHLSPAALPGLLNQRNITTPGGTLNASGRNLKITAEGEFHTIDEIGGIPVIQNPGQSPVYLRDVFDVTRGYVSPPTFLNFYTYRDSSGHWQRTRAITISLQMRSGEQIGAFAKAVDCAIASVKQRLPGDLIIARTSDQPRQVKENVDLFMTSLWEAVALVVLVSFIGFWEWRSAALMALSIPITLAMTFGMMSALGIDVQQISIASLIIALGLLVDDPVVAGDAIKRELAAGKSRATAAWLGPTKLSRAILFATITNIVAYLPFLLLHGDTGRFMYSMPIVITCSLVASRLVSMTFIPLLGEWILRGKHEPSMQQRRTRGFGALYYRVGDFSIQHRKLVLFGALLTLPLGIVFVKQLKPMFFPQDLQYLSTVDVWLPEGAPFVSTLHAGSDAERIIREVADHYGQTAHRENAQQPVLKSLTTFAGGGGPRFWFSVPPEPPQLNYAQIVVETADKHDTNALVPELQHALSTEIAGARVDVRKLETGPPVGIPISLRIVGNDIRVLRTQAEKLKAIFHQIPSAARIRDDWGEERVTVDVATDPDRAALTAVTQEDVANASLVAFSGLRVGTLRERDKLIPVVLRQPSHDRDQISDLKDIYVYSGQDGHRVPLNEVATLSVRMEPETIRHFNRFRAITVSAFPVSGVLPSEVLSAAMPQIKQWEKQLPPGYRMLYAGEYKEQTKGFADLAMVMAISVLAIYIALVLQFRNALKPLIVFTAIPFGLVGAFAALFLMDQSFGFTAFLGIASLIGVIVSHIIVLFDFIEERREMGEPLREALLDAGILRLRPVLITVAATVIALLPLAAHGGPLWQPLCYSQAGGLILSAVITLLLIPTVYAFVVLDLKWIKWDARETIAGNIHIEEAELELVGSTH